VKKQYPIADRISSWFRDALRIVDFNKSCKGDRARSLFMLSQALQATPEPCPDDVKKEASEKLQEARSWRRKILGGNDDQGYDDTPLAYDKLVCMHVR